MSTQFHDEDDKDDKIPYPTVCCGKYDLHIAYKRSALTERSDPNDYVNISVSICPAGWEGHIYYPKNVVPDKCPRIVELVVPRGIGDREQFEASTCSLLSATLNTSADCHIISTKPRTPKRYTQGAQWIEQQLLSAFGKVPESSPLEDDTPVGFGPYSLGENMHSRFSPREQGIVSALTAVAAQVDEDAEYNVYKQSFGLQVMMHRNRRGLSQEQLANALASKIGEGTTITERDVERWETAIALPDPNQFAALACVLIDDNEKIAAINKEAAHTVFRAAYAQPQLRIEENIGGAVTYAQAKAVFTRLLRQLIDDIGVSFEELAIRTQARKRFEIDVQEQEYLEQDKGVFIAGIAAGVVLPSKNLMLALAAALDVQDQRATALYGAYEQVTFATDPATQQVTQARVRTTKATNDNGLAGPRRRITHNEATTCDAIQLRACKDKLRGYFVEAEDNPISIIAIARAVFRHPASGATALSNLMGTHNNTNPRTAGVLSETTRQPLERYLRDHLSKPDAVIAEFNRDFNALRDLTGYTSSLAPCSDEAINQAALSI